MSDNISRKAAKDAIAEKVFHDLTDEFYGVMQVLDELPSTDRKGHWKIYDHVDRIGRVIGEKICVCDQCKETMTLSWMVKVPNFCPNCGADMRGENDERK